MSDELNVPCENSCGCRPKPGGLSRREFARLVGFGSAAAALLSRLPAMGADLDPADFETLIPAEKNLDPRWVESLFARGTPEVHRGDELRFIGMPVGGIGAGQVYLGGDGKLWHWDIFNKPINSGNTGPHYFRPLTQKTPFGQGFALRVLSGGATVTRTLDAKARRRAWTEDRPASGRWGSATPEWSAIPGDPYTFGLAMRESSWPREDCWMKVCQVIYGPLRTART